MNSSPQYFRSRYFSTIRIPKPLFSSIHNIHSWNIFRRKYEPAKVKFNKLFQINRSFGTIFKTYNTQTNINTSTQSTASTQDKQINFSPDLWDEIKIMGKKMMVHQEKIIECKRDEKFLIRFCDIATMASLGCASFMSEDFFVYFFWNLTAYTWLYSFFKIIDLADIKLLDKELHIEKRKFIDETIFRHIHSNNFNDVKTILDLMPTIFEDKIQLYYLYALCLYKSGNIPLSDTYYSLLFSPGYTEDTLFYKKDYSHFDDLLLTMKTTTGATKPSFSQEICKSLHYIYEKCNNYDLSKYYRKKSKG